MAEMFYWQRLNNVKKFLLEEIINCRVFLMAGIINVVKPHCQGQEEV